VTHAHVEDSNHWSSHFDEALLNQLLLVDRDAPVVVANALEGRTQYLDPLTEAFVRLAVAASPARLDRDTTHQAMQAALNAGATQAQVLDVLAISTVIGFHTLTEAIPVLSTLVDSPSDASDNAGGLPQGAYWDRFSEYIPGFLGPLANRSPKMLESFLDFAAIPWKSRNLTPQHIEQLYVAIDVAPEHRYLPGLRFHIANSLEIGVSPSALLEVFVCSSDENPIAALTLGLPVLLQEQARFHGNV
jgi:alkylhydroperoxidase/carboxymuconolactone decarboxylase family protein YurZ